ncbi:MAG: TetR family transcriptional regulator [Allorhizobium sp.]
MLANEAQLRRPRRKAEETRLDILTVAERLFRERGYSNVAIADIAATLNMSPANVFKHFHTKTKLVDAISSQYIEKAVDRFSSPDINLPPQERLRLLVKHLMDSHIRDLEESPYIFEMILLTASQDLDCAHRYREMMVAEIESIICEGVRCGTYHVKDCHRAATAASFAFACVLHPVMIANEKPDILATRCREVVDLVNAALQNRLQSDDC